MATKHLELPTLAFPRCSLVPRVHCPGHQEEGGSPSPLGLSRPPLLCFLQPPQLFQWPPKNHGPHHSLLLNWICFSVSLCSSSRKKKSWAEQGIKWADWESFQKNQCLSLARCSRRSHRCCHRDSRWSDPPSLPREARCWQRSTWFMPTLSTLSIPGNMHDALLTFIQSSLKPQEVGAVIPRLQVISVTSHT